MYAIPAFLYVNAATPEQAARLKQEMEKLLADPFIKKMIATRVVGYHDAILQEPQPVRR